MIADAAHAPLFGEKERSGTAAIEGLCDPPCYQDSATASAARHSQTASEVDPEDEMQDWSMSALEAPLPKVSQQEALRLVTLGDSRERQTAGGGSSRRLTSGKHAAALPSGFVVDDLQGSSVSLSQPSGFAAASAAEREPARSIHLDAMHDLHDPEGSGAASTLSVPFLLWHCASSQLHDCFCNDALHVVHAAVLGSMVCRACDACCLAGHRMAARVNHWVDGLLIKPFTASNAAAAERSDEQVQAPFYTDILILRCNPRLCAVLGSPW